MADPKIKPMFSVFEHDPEMADIVAAFVVEMPDRRREIREAVDANDAAAVETMAHQLKGAAAGYGFEPLGDAAAQAERSVQDLRAANNSVDHPSLLEAVEPLLAACERVRLSLQRALA